MSTTKYIIINGGTLSGVGKGVITSSIGKILQEYGFIVTAIKIDPYFNMDSGTLNPKEHGEVWVTYDGMETDQDLGNYERFLGVKLPKRNSITSGQIYRAVSDKERNGVYKGETVQFIPHITNEVRDRIIECSTSQTPEGTNMVYDIVLVEIGGIVGDYENIPFLVGTKSLESVVGKENILYSLVTYAPTPSHLGEMKTKLTQSAIREIMHHCITPDMILCRGKHMLDDIRKQKIETYVSGTVNKDYIISVPDADSIYNVPIILEEQILGHKIFKKLNLIPKKNPDWTLWRNLTNTIVNSTKIINVAISCKYITTGDCQITDSYLSISEALKHAGSHLGVKIMIQWIDSNLLNRENVNDVLGRVDCILVPGGFGTTGVNGKLLTIEHARKNDIPFLGICYGMQLAVVEYAQNVCSLTNAHTTEVDPNTEYPVVDILKEQHNIKQLGGTLKLGEYVSTLQKGTLVQSLYNNETATERHRHRYEVNYKFVPILENFGMVFSGKIINKDTGIDPINSIDSIEFIELPQNKFFVATQSHPELTSSLIKPNPLFLGFLNAAVQHSNKN